jgi:hypothetical protein
MGHGPCTAGDWQVESVAAAIAEAEHDATRRERDRWGREVTKLVEMAVAPRDCGGGLDVEDLVSLIRRMEAGDE